MKRGVFTPELSPARVREMRDEIASMRREARQRDADGDHVQAGRLRGLADADERQIRDAGH